LEEKEEMKAISYVKTPKPIVNLMVDLITREKDCSILDTGCGDGTFIESLLEKDFSHIDGIDIDEKFIKDCKVRFPILNFYHFDYLIWSPAEFYEVIIGNPPYAHYNALPPFIKEELFEITGVKETDIYYGFIMKSIENIRWVNGELIYIVPYGFFYNTYARNLKKTLVENGYIDLLIDLDETRLFEGEHPETIIFRYRTASLAEYIDRKVQILRVKDRNAKPDEIYQYALDSIHNRHENQLFFYHEQTPFIDPEVPWSSHPRFDIPDFDYLKDVCFIGVGMVSGCEDAFNIDANYYLEKKLTIDEKNTTHSFIKGKNCKGYWIEGHSKYIIFNTSIMEEDIIQEKYPNLYEKISMYKDKMSRRYMPKGKPWFHWQALRNKANVEKYLEYPKIFVPTLDRSKKNRFSLTYNFFYPSGDVLIIIPLKIDPFFLLGYLNSEFFRRYYLSYGGRRGHRIAYTQGLLSNIKIPRFKNGTIQQIKRLTQELFESHDISKRDLIDEIINNELLHVS
jgi:adenine-specific DNA-methyltransferase